MLAASGPGGMTQAFRPVAAGLDPAAHRYDPAAWPSSSNWGDYVRVIYDPTVDNENQESEPEICLILGDTAVLEREPKDATSQRFTVNPAALWPVVIPYPVLPWRGGTAGAVIPRTPRTLAPRPPPPARARVPADVARP